MRNSTTTDAAPRPSTLMSRLLWFVGLWCGGVAAVGAIAAVFRLLLPH